MKNTLRIRDLVKATDITASTIHYYLKEGLLPQPEKPTPNSALYNTEHLALLQQIKKLKTLAPELPLIQIKRILELTRQGVELEVALSLHRSIAPAGSPDASAESGPMSLQELACKGGVDSELIHALVERNILVPLAQPSDKPFDRSDLEVVHAVSTFTQMSPQGLDAVSQVASLLKKASAIEMSMRDALSANADAARAAAISAQMQAWGNFWHSYLFSRFRLAEIEKHGLGPVNDSDTQRE